MRLHEILVLGFAFLNALSTTTATPPCQDVGWYNHAGVWYSCAELMENGVDICGDKFLLEHCCITCSKDCTDVGWRGNDGYWWSCMLIERHYLDTYGLRPEEWCKDVKSNARCCWTCSASKPCQDLGWTDTDGIWRSCPDIKTDYANEHGGADMCKNALFLDLCCATCSSGCKDVGWKDQINGGWITCPYIARHYLDKYGLRPEEWCKDVNRNDRCCLTCNECLDPGYWDGYELMPCQNVSEMFLNDFKIGRAEWCLDPFWYTRCCVLCNECVDWGWLSSENVWWSCKEISDYLLETHGETRDVMCSSSYYSVQCCVTCRDCEDVGWTGVDGEYWSCPRLSEYFLHAFGQTPDEWCYDSYWYDMCCATCNA